MALLALELPEPLMGLLHTCEVICVTGCCGVDAYDLDPRHMQSWIKDRNIREAMQSWEQLGDAIETISERIDVSEVVSNEYQFNAIWNPRGECVDYLQKWRHVIRKAVEDFRGGPLLDSSWQTTTAIAIAECISDDQAFDRLPILADALQDAACEEADILDHCRGDGPHVRGCWVVDLLLGKK